MYPSSNFYRTQILLSPQILNIIKLQQAANFRITAAAANFIKLQILRSCKFRHELEKLEGKFIIFYLLKKLFFKKLRIEKKKNFRYNIYRKVEGGKREMDLLDDFVLFMTCEELAATEFFEKQDNEILTSDQN